MDELYALYRRCFPDYPAAEAVFRECLKRERGQVLYAGEGGETVGYALIHGGSLSLLCVDRRYRNRGHGAALLEAAETRIRASGADRVLLGRGRYYLLQGVPAEDPAVPAFFERRGYAASWTSVNMRLDLRGFGAGRLDIPPAPETVGFRFARDADRAALLAAVDDAVADSVYLAHALHDAVLCAGELVDDRGNGLGVGRQGDVLVEHGLAADERGVLQVTVDADALAQALGQDGLGLHVDELVLQGRASGVDDQNFHFSSILSNSCVVKIFRP